MEQAQQLSERAARLPAATSSQALSAPARASATCTTSCVEVNRLENEGDRITREALASLFANGIDPMVVIRWKDIFERHRAGDRRLRDGREHPRVDRRQARVEAASAVVMPQAV